MPCDAKDHSPCHCVMFRSRVQIQVPGLHNRRAIGVRRRYVRRTTGPHIDHALEGLRRLGSNFLPALQGTSRLPGYGIGGTLPVYNHLRVGLRHNLYPEVASPRIPYLSACPSLQWPIFDQSLRYDEPELLQIAEYLSCYGIDTFYHLSIQYGFS